VVVRLRPDTEPVTFLLDLLRRLVREEVASPAP
jgi:hypothetical protein